MKVGLSDKKRNPAYTWNEWLKVCVEKMKIEFKPSTVINYKGQLSKWTDPVWGRRKIQEIAPSDVHDLVFNAVEGVTQTTRKTILKMIKRIFQMAIEEGILNRSPALKIRVKVPERKQGVLNATEVDIFLINQNTANPMHNGKLIATRDNWDLFNLYNAASCIAIKNIVNLMSNQNIGLSAFCRFQGSITQLNDNGDPVSHTNTNRI